MSPTAKLYQWQQIPPESLSPSLQRQFLFGEQAMLARILLKKGCIVPEHQHHNEQISMIVSGTLEFTLGDTIHRVHAGEVLVIPGGTLHSAVALEDTENLDFFAPPRQDWIEGNDAYLRQGVEKD